MEATTKEIIRSQAKLFLTLKSVSSLIINHIYSAYVHRIPDNYPPHFHPLIRLLSLIFHTSSFPTFVLALFLSTLHIFICASPPHQSPRMEEGPVYLELDKVNAENPEHYRQGGYLPVHIGQRIAKRFKIVHKLGYGAFATVWLACEEDKSRYVALKIVTADQSKTYEAAPEVASLPRNSRGFFLAEHERFFVDSRNGRHLCQVFPVLGPTLDDLTDFHHRLYPECVQDFARQMVLAVDTMHLNDLCHGGEFSPSSQ